MPKVRIITTPPGQAPEWVRKKWVGLEMETTGQAPRDAPLRGAVTGELEPDPPNAEGYEVFAAEAIHQLRVTSPETAEWWENNTSVLDRSGVKFVFKKDVCELLPSPKN